MECRFPENPAAEVQKSKNTGTASVTIQQKLPAKEAQP